MKALTLWQPWGWAVVEGYKAVENRSWPPPHALIGQRIAIHAGKTWDRYGADTVADLIGIDAFPDAAHVAGAAIGVATIERIVHSRPHPVGYSDHRPDLHLSPDERAWFFGPFGWILRDVRRLPTPVPCRGAQLLWTLPADVEARVVAQLGARCGRYVGDNDATCPQITCVRFAGHPGPCDNVRGDEATP